MNMEDNTEFAIPENFLDKLYELTGSANKYKGFILVYSNEKGTPIIFNKCEAPLIEMGLTKTLESYLEKVQEENNDI